MYSVPSTNYNHHHHHIRHNHGVVTSFKDHLISPSASPLRIIMEKEDNGKIGEDFLADGQNQDNNSIVSMFSNILINATTEMSVNISEEGEPDGGIGILMSPSFNVTTLAANDTIITTPTGPTSPLLSNMYMIVSPAMILFCALTCVVNLVIVISAKWCRRPMSPTLYYSISLALADAYAAFCLGLGIMINSYLPAVYKIKFSSCSSLVLEAFRSGGVLVTIFHLLALGINHWIGIVRPLHYAATMTRRTAWTVIVISWTIPIIVLLMYFSSIEGSGFRSVNCENYAFLKQFRYRSFFVTLIVVPLCLLCLIYLHIFIIVRSHQTNRIRYQSSQALRKNVKAALTTVLILGTYIVGWMPATVFNIIVCEDCAIKLQEVSIGVRVSTGITVNVLVILKTFVDPIIYAARMNDIKLSLKKMRYDFLKFFCKPCCRSLQPPEEDRGGYFGSSTATRTSMYDTRSMRMSSFGSNSNSNSSRRLGGGTGTGSSSGNGNLINNNSPAGSVSGSHRGSHRSSCNLHSNNPSGRNHHQQSNGGGGGSVMIPSRSNSSKATLLLPKPMDGCNSANNSNSSNPIGNPRQGNTMRAATTYGDSMMMSDCKGMMMTDDNSVC